MRDNACARHLGKLCCDGAFFLHPLPPLQCILFLIRNLRVGWKIAEPWEVEERDGGGWELRFRWYEHLKMAMVSKAQCELWVRSQSCQNVWTIPVTHPPPLLPPPAPDCFDCCVANKNSQLASNIADNIWL